MKSLLTINCFENAANRFIKAEAEVLSESESPCQCSVPGGIRECKNCVYFIELVEEIQHKLAPNPEQVFPQVFVSPCFPPYANTVLQQCLELRMQGYSLTKISRMTGLNDRTFLRKFLKDQGLLKGLADCNESDKQHCIELYKAGKLPLEIEDETGIRADVISIWVGYGKDLKSQVVYTPDQRQICLSLYLKGKSFKEVEKLTGVKSEAIRYWARETDVVRKKGERTVGSFVYPQEVRDACRELWEKRYSAVQIAEMLNIGVTTVKRWKKEGFLIPGTENQGEQPPPS